MLTPSVSRVRKELVECQKDYEITGVTAESISEDLKSLKGTICGPESTPYAGGVFHLDISIPAK